MSAATESTQLTLAGHAITSVERAGGMLSLRIALQGRSIRELAQALARLDGVRVTSGPDSTGRERCFVAQCPGFKLVVSAPAAVDADSALALVSRTPQAALRVISDLGTSLERLMTVPPRPADLISMTAPASPLNRSSSLQRGKPLARRTALRRKTPLARGRFR
jgi:hypothetical protein